MRILFVAMPDSVHTARWIRQLSGRGWDLHVFPINAGRPHETLSGVTLHPFNRLSDRVARRDLSARLASVIRHVKPDIVHSLGMQFCAYPTLAAKHVLGGTMPRWIVSSWGQDLYLFGRLAAHIPKIRAVLAECDFFTADCERDLGLARKHGFRGGTFPAQPGGGGLDIDLARSLRPPGPPSARRTITLKGYQHWYGRALDGLQAIELCADLLRDYSVTIYFPNKDVEVAAELMSQRTNIVTEIFPNSSYEDSLRMHARARVSISVNISDGLPLSTMEAALMGSFPIQTDTSCIGERLTDGLGTLLVPPDDPPAIAAALRRALTDNELVDRAAELNFRYIAERLSMSAVQPKVISMYEEAA